MAEHDRNLGSPVDEPDRQSEERQRAGISSRSDDRTTVVRLCARLLERWRWLVVIPLLGSIVGLSVAALEKERWVAESRFMPHETEGQQSVILDLARQFGTSAAAATSSQAQSPEFYAELIESRELLRDVALSTYEIGPDEGLRREGTLLELFAVEAANREREIATIIGRLRRDIALSVDPTTALVTVSTMADWPELAIQINRRLLDLTNRFNLEKRQSSAAAERAFIERRLAEAREQLTAAESTFARFLQNNKQYENSPQLSFEAASLQRRVDLQHQTYMSLAQSLENARLEEVRNTPVITVIEPPDHSVQRASQDLLFNASAGALLGVLLSLGLVYGADHIRRERLNYPEDFEQLRVAWQSFRSDLSELRPWRSRGR